MPAPTPPSLLALRQQLQALVIDYWHDVDFHHGAQAHTYYTPDAIFATSVKRRQGQDAIQAFYADRQSRGARVSLHLVHNFRIEPVSPTEVAINYVLALHAADGEPVLPSRPAIMLADARERAVAMPDGQWRFSLRELHPLFRDDTPTTG